MSEVGISAGGAAFKALPRGTLHIVLTKPGDQGLRLTRPAAEHWQAALASVGSFQAVEASEHAPNVADPRTTAAAIAAQVRGVAPQLLAAGAFLTSFSALPCTKTLHV